MPRWPHSSHPMTSPAATIEPAATAGESGSYVVRNAPWLTVTTPRPASTPLNVTVPGPAA